MNSWVGKVLSQNRKGTVNVVYPLVFNQSE
jgi:hypothetical protein